MTPPSQVNNPSDSSRAVEHAHGGPAHARPLFAPVGLTATPNALGLLKALRRRLPLALTVGLLVAAAAGAAVWFLLPPPKITARTQLHVAVAAPQILFADDNRINNDTFLRSQAYLIKDRFVLNAALRSPETAGLSLVKEQPDPVQWLEKEIKVEFPSPEFIHITLSGDRPAELLKLVSAVTQAYLDGVVNKEHNLRQGKLENLKKVSSRFEERSRSKRTTLRQLQEDNGALDQKNMAILQQVALEDLHGVKKDLTQVRHDLRHLQVELGLRPDWVESVWPQYVGVLNCFPAPGLPMNHALVALLHDDALMAMAAPSASSAIGSRALDELIDKDKTVAEGLKQIQSLQIKIEHMREVFQPDAYEKNSEPLRKQIVEVAKEMEARRQELRPHYFDKYREQLRREAQGNRRQMLEKYSALKEMERVLVSEASRLAEETRQIRKNAVDLAQLKEDIDKDEKVMQKAGEKINNLEVEQEAPPRITQPDKEAVLYTPDATKRQLMVAGGTAGGALVFVLLAFAWLEFHARKVHSPDEVVTGLGLRLVGTVPDHSRRDWLSWIRRSGGNEAYTQSLLTESVDAARTLVLHTAQTEKLQIVMITSALAGEGKTSLASHLAASLARAGRRTLLLDSDLRNPTLHRLFERSRAPGLSEVLRGDAPLADVIRDTPIPGLWLISAGQADPIALQALALDALPRIFVELRSQYDFIVVDSCPVLPVADSLLVGQHVDAVIFSLLRHVSRLPRVYAAYERLSLLSIRMLGAVVNGTQNDLYQADYHYVSPDNE
jgi:capsular exopolysaccharide synthesis family protein